MTDIEQKALEMISAARTLEQAVALKTICSLELKYLELVK